MVTEARSMGDAAKELRQNLQEKQLLVKEGDFFLLKEDQFFKTPSGAAQFATGTSSNGWVEWKDAQGKTLSEIINRNSNL
jgi:hypothetical protein